MVTVVIDSGHRAAKLSQSLYISGLALRAFLSIDVACVANRQTVVYICHVSTKIFI